MNERVLPTAEQLAKGGHTYKATRDAERAKRAGEFDLVNLHECQLDRMYHTGRLGGGRTAEDRYDAGCWLRSLYVTTHNVSEGVADYDGIGHDQSDPSDAQAWNLKVFMDTTQAMKGHWVPLEQVCCMDNEWRYNSDMLWNALDFLAEYRGITGEKKRYA